MSSPAAVDPSDVSVSTTKDGATAEATTSGSSIQDQLGPSTSSEAAGHRRRQVDGPGSSEALRRPRKSLPFIPRTTQYERHPLLQMRSTATGLSEFELLMLERDADDRPRRMSVESSRTSPAADRVGSRPALVPRTTQREVHPLFVRSADSGISELEEYLKEISEMTPPARKSSAVGSQARSSVSSQPPPPPPTSSSSADGESRATAPAPRKLEPRTSQCERHALLEIKDESGLSELERLLMEKDEAAAAAASGGTDGRRCTVCGAETALGCDCTRRTGRLGANAASGAFSSFDSTTSAQQKRVRFMQQRQKTEPEDVAAGVQLERTMSDNTGTPAAVQPQAVKTNSIDSSAAKKSGKSRSSRGRGSGLRADSTPAGVGSGSTAHRKSCCVS